jgi:hypothetical protein
MVLFIRKYKGGRRIVLEFHVAKKMAGMSQIVLLSTKILKKLEKDHSEKFKRNQVQRKRCK